MIAKIALLAFVVSAAFGASEANPATPATPATLTYASLGATGVVLTWRFDPKDRTDGTLTTGCFSIYYQKGSGNTDSRQSCDEKHTYELLGLEPNTNYKIWVEKKRWSSNPVTIHTDVGQPGSPVLTNATCLDTGTLRIQWTRPSHFHSQVHSYKIYYKEDSEATYKSVTHLVNASLTNETHYNHVLGNLTTSSTYSVKICAQSFGTRPGNKSAMSEPSREAKVFLPDHKCQRKEDGVTDFTTGILVGTFGVAFLVLLALACFLEKKFRFSHRRVSVRKSEPRPTRGERIYDFGKKFGPDFLSESIHVDDFSAHVAKLHSDGDIGFANEYEEIQSFCKKTIVAKHESSSLKENKPKNRYLNIVAFDHSRVPLRQESLFRRIPGYINANFIDSFQRCKSYIATQGPMEHTIKDFWRMIWEQNVRVVVMITNLMERGRKKCDQYWPNSGSITFGKFEVTLMKETELSNYTIRCIQITNLGVKVGENVRQLQQFHYTTWSDHGIPEHPLPVLSFVRKSVNANPADGGPIVIHCSAGVGRTGTFIMIDSMLQQVELMKSVNISGFLKYVRTQRHHLVQTEDQYLFCHDIILEAIGCGRTEIHSSHFKDYVSKLEMPFWQDNNELNEERIIDKQFKLVTDYVPAECQHATAKKAEHVGRNRDPNLMAIENYKVNFQRKSSELQLKYFNASWLSGHFKLREFILCQLPLSSELDLFWQMIYDTASQTIAMLSEINDKDCLQFWPDQSEEMSFEALIVRKVDETNENGIRILNFVVSCSHKSSDDLSVRMIVNPGWPHVTKDISRVFDVVNITNEQKVISSRGCYGPLVVVDKFGGTEGATFCALLTLCNQLQSFNSVDVYLTTKLVHHRRPGIWKSPDDLLFIYKCLLAKISLEQSSSQVKLAENDEVLPTSLSNSNGPHWSQSRLTKKSSSGFGLSSSGTSTTNTTEDDVAQNRRFSFPPNFLTSSCDQGDDASKKDDVEIEDEHTALKSPLLKANSYDV